MAILDPFRPKWQNSDPKIREEAVRRLGHEETEALAQIAREDTEPSIRRLAIKRLRDPKVLAELASHEPDASLKKLAADKADSLWTATAIGGDDPAASESALASIVDQRAIASIVCDAHLESVRAAALDRLSDPHALGEVARRGADPALRAKALSSVTSVSVLRHVAMHDTDDTIAIAAVDKLDDLEALETVARDGQRKAAKQRAIERMGEKGTAFHPVATRQRRAKQLGLVESVEALASSWSFTAAEKSMAEARKDWVELGTDADDKLRARLDQAIEGFIVRRAEHASRNSAGESAAAADETTDAKKASRSGVPAAGVPASDVPAAGVPASDVPASDVPAGSVPAGSVPASVPASGAPAAGAPAAAAPQVTGLIGLLEAAEALVDLPNVVSARKKFSELTRSLAAVGESEVRDPHFELRWRRVGERLSEREVEAEAKAKVDREKNLARVTALCARIEKLITTDVLKGTVGTLTKAQATLKKVGPLPSGTNRDELLQRLDAATRALRTRVEELREGEEWKRWSNIPAREALCVAIEELQKETDPRLASKKLRDLQKRWKESGPVPREKSDELWERFRTAMKTIRKVCDQGFAKLDKENKGNLVLKRALCEKAAELKESTDWRATADKLKALQQEWKAIGPVPRADSNKIWARFREPCDYFFARRKEVFDKLDEGRGQNLDQKEKMVERAEALAQSWDWDQTASELKKLQSEWKNVGPGPRKKGDEIWKRFRGACDTFFKRYNRRGDLELDQNLDKVTALIAELEKLLPASEPAAEAPAAVDEPVAAAAAVVAEAPVAAEEAVVAEAPAASEDAPVTEAPTTADEPAVAELPEAVAELPEVVADEPAAPADEPAAPAALSDDEIKSRVAEARAAIHTVGPLPGNKEDAALSRFSAALNLVAAAHPAAFTGTDLDPEVLLKKKGELIARAEKLLEKPAEQERGESVQDLAEQLRNAFAANTFRSSETDKDAGTAELRKNLKSLEAGWNKIGLIPGDDAARLEESFRALLKKIRRRLKDAS